MGLMTKDVMKVNQLIAKQKFNAALRCLDEVLSREPSNHFFRKQQAELLYKLGKKRESYSVLSKIVQQFMTAGFYTKALASLKHMKRLFPDKVGEIQEQEHIVATKIAEEPPPEKHQTFATPDEGIRLVEATDELIITHGQHYHPEGEIEMTIEPQQEAQELDALVNSPLFRLFSLNELKPLLDMLEMRSFGPGEIVFTEGEKGASLMVLVHGNLRVYVSNKARHNEQVRILEEGAFFGEIGLVTGKARTATLTAMDNVEALELNSAALHNLAEKHPEVYDIIIDYYQRRMGSPEEVEARSRQ